MNELELTIWPDVDLVSVTRRYVEEVYEKVFVDDDHETVTRIALTVHELLENAVKYCNGGAARLRVAIERGADRDRLTISVINAAHASHLVTLRERLAAIGAAASPCELYQQLMRKSGRAELGSGLGLARISAEAQMALGCEHSSGRVCVSARTDIHKRSGT